MNNKMFFMWFNLIFVVLLYGAVGKEGQINAEEIKKVALKKFNAGFFSPGLKKPFELAVVVPKFLIQKTKEGGKASAGCLFLGSLLCFLLYKDGHFKRAFDFLSNKIVSSNFNIYPNFMDFDRKTSLIITWLSFVFSSSIVHSYIRYDENKSLFKEASIKDDEIKLPLSQGTQATKKDDEIKLPLSQGTQATKKDDEINQSSVVNQGGYFF